MIRRLRLTGVNTTGGIVSSSFSRGASITDPTAAAIVVWRAMTSCTVTKVNGYRVGGSGATVNARKNGASLLLTSDLSLSTESAWLSSSTIQNALFVSGDSLEVMVTAVSGFPSQVAIQVDFVTT